MKKLFTLLFPLFIIACSSDDNNTVKPKYSLKEYAEVMVGEYDYYTKNLLTGEVTDGYIRRFNYNYSSISGTDYIYFSSVDYLDQVTLYDGFLTGDLNYITISGKSDYYVEDGFNENTGKFVEVVGGTYEVEGFFEPFGENVARFQIYATYDIDYFPEMPELLGHHEYVHVSHLSLLP